MEIKECCPKRKVARTGVYVIIIILVVYLLMLYVNFEDNLGVKTVAAFVVAGFTYILLKIVSNILLDDCKNYVIDA